MSYELGSLIFFNVLMALISGFFLWIASRPTAPSSYVMNNKTLSPPQGYASWIAYAIATMDVRGVQLETMFEDSATGTPSREEIRAAAQAELDALVRSAAK